MHSQTFKFSNPLGQQYAVSYIAAEDCLAPAWWYYEVAIIRPVTGVEIIETNIPDSDTAFDIAYAHAGLSNPYVRS